MMHRTKIIEPKDPETTRETASQSAIRVLLIKSTLRANGDLIILANMAKKVAINKLDPGPESATKAEPHL